MLDKLKNCQRVTELISLSHEKTLSSAEHLEVKFHLMICPYCRDFAHNTQMLKKITKAHNQPMSYPPNNEVGDTNKA